MAEEPADHNRAASAPSPETPEVMGAHITSYAADSSVNGYGAHWLPGDPKADEKADNCAALLREPLASLGLEVRRPAPGYLMVQLPKSMNESDRRDAMLRVAETIHKLGGFAVAGRDLDRGGR
jgi:hypothetical protein